VDQLQFLDKKKDLLKLATQLMVGTGNSIEVDSSHPLHPDSNFTKPKPSDSYPLEELDGNFHTMALTLTLMAAKAY
jgi:hypothetical protein